MELISPMKGAPSITDQNTAGCKIVTYESPLDKMAAILADDILKCIFLNEKFCIFIKISLKYVPKGPMDNNPALVQIMVWRRIGDRPLSEPMLNRFIDAYMRH